ncbi:MAG: hypothetical protein IKJ17_01000, partial [Clostridia bacterium]|nr:hypothetical protein [Clostridia bacterium]
DPTVTPKLNATEIKDATVMFTNYNATMEDWAMRYHTGIFYDHLVAGKYPNSSVEVGYCIYADIPEGIPDTARIVKATLGVASSYAETNVYVNDVRFDAFKITSDWNTGDINEESILFNTPNTNGYTIPTTDTEAIDYRYLYEGIQNYHDFDVTKAAQEWHSSGNNYGIMLRMDEYSLSSNYLMSFFSSDYNIGGVTNRPIFVYNFRDTSGLEDYWSYHSASVGNAGTGYVNDFGGNLTFIHNDTSYVNERYNVSIAHVYNVNIADNLASTDEQPYGNGWRLNIGEVGCEEIENVDYRYYIDGDGTEHYFYKDDDKYKDEDGLGYVYIPENNGTLRGEMTTKSHETIKFDADGRLYSITDSNSNCVEFTYGDCGLETVKIGNNTIIILAYSGGKLSSLTNNKTSRTTSYSYDTSGNLISITQNWNSNTADTYTYTYSGNLLTSATDSDGYRITYAYDQNGTVSQVKSVTESALEGENYINGQTMTFSYKNGNRTVVEDCGLDGNILTTADNNKMTYLFDVYGQPVSVYDEEGNGASYKYSGIENKKHNLTLSSATYGYIPGGDLVKEGDFSYGGAFWSTTGNAEYTGSGFTLSEGEKIYQ